MQMSVCMTYWHISSDHHFLTDGKKVKKKKPEKESEKEKEKETKKKVKSVPKKKKGASLVVCVREIWT